MRPFVLAIGTTPAQALQAHATLRALDETAELRGRRARFDQWHYKGFGFRFVDLDADDPIEGPIARTVAAAEQRLEAEAEAEFTSGRFTSRFVVPVSVIVAVVPAIASGMIGAAGGDLWKVVKRSVAAGWRRLRGRPAPQEDRPLPRLLEELAEFYRDKGPIFGPLLLRLPDVRITLLVEPDLPERAKRAAERRIAAGAAGSGGATERPLRWDRQRRDWLELDDDWAEERPLRELAREIRSSAQRPSD
jgi:hypothetical protein